MAMEAGQAAAYVFLSYASADRERALQIADLLEAQGIAVWIDRKSIAGGTSWGKEIVRGIRECAVLVVACTPAAVVSPNVQQEIQLAWETRRPILPLLLQAVELPDSIRYAIAGRQWVEVLDHAGTVWLPPLLNALRLLGVGERRSALVGVEAASVAVASPPPVDQPRHNLPAQLSSYVGRTAEQVEVKRLLQSTRLLTVTGVGGTGKTRFALQVAGDLLDTFPDGVWFVDLAPISDRSLVAQAIAGALSVPEQAGQPMLTTLLQTLRDLHLLVLLDNCEHLTESCAQAAASLLRGCPRVQILATSRESLGITGEVSWRLPSLPVPPRDWRVEQPDSGLAKVEEFDAVRLFVERARAVDHSFALSAENAQAVVQICQRLDGIPLALELAAARVKAFSAERIAARLDDLFRLLTGGSRAALPRQQTLRALIDWSYNLLSEPERVLFRRLAVFAGGCTYEAIEGVAAGEGIDELDLPDLLARLVDRSLVVAERTATERYRLLETLRQYGQEHLVGAGEIERLRDLHRDWYLKLALEAGKQYTGPDQGRWYDALEQDQDNLRTAIEWCISRGSAGPGLEFAWGLTAFWFFRGYRQEGLSFAERLLALRGAEARTRGRAIALWSASAGDRDWDRARRLQQEAIAIARDVGEVRASANWALYLAAFEAADGHDQAAMELIRESLATARRTGDA